MTGLETLTLFLVAIDVVFLVVVTVGVGVYAIVSSVRRSREARKVLGSEKGFKNYKVLKSFYWHLLSETLFDTSVSEFEGSRFVVSERATTINSMDRANDLSVEATILGLKELAQVAEDFRSKQADARLAPELSRVNAIVYGNRLRETKGLGNG